MKRHSKGRFANRPYRTLMFTLSLIVFLGAPAWAITLHECTALTGSAANSLDALAYASLSDTNIAIVTASQKSYIFRWNAASSASENVTTHPYTVRADDDGGGVGRWLEATAESISTDALTITNAVDTYPLDIECSKAGSQYIRMVHSGNQNVGLSVQRSEGGGSYNVQWLTYVPVSETNLKWWTDGGATTAMYLTAADGDLWVRGDLTAASYADNTPMYAGDAACSLIKPIGTTKAAVKGQWGNMDHDTLPPGVLIEKTEKNEKGEPVRVTRRNVSAMVSLLTAAVQELTARIEALEKK